jgi:hypothetical protein
LLTHHQAGGGVPKVVARDRCNGKVTVNAARARYGVEAEPLRQGQCGRD